MKILFYTDNPVAGGGNRYFVDLINAASVEGNELLIYTNKNGFFQEDIDRLRKKNSIIEIDRISRESFALKYFGTSQLADIIKKIGLLFKPIFFIINYFRFKVLLQSIRPNLVISSNGGYPGGESPIAILFAAWACNTKAILTIVSMPASRRWYLYLYDLFLDRLLSISKSIVIVNSNAQIAALRTIRGLTNEIYCIYNGLEDVASSFVKDTDDSVNVYLGTVCRLDRGKGLDYLLRAIRILKDKGVKNIKCAVFGKGSEYDALNDLILKLKIEDIVELKGYVHGEIYHQLEKFDIFVFPSLWEGLPYSLVEAQRSGLPIISTNVGGIPEVVRHMQEGMLVEPQNSLELANSIDYLVNNRELRIKMAQNSRERYITMFSMKVMEENFRKIIFQVVN